MYIMYSFVVRGAKETQKLDVFMYLLFVCLFMYLICCLYIFLLMRSGIFLYGCFAAVVVLHL